MNSSDHDRTQREKSEYVGSAVGGFATRLSTHVRKALFKSLMRLAQPTAQTTVMDVGVTCDRRADSNFFEKLYPYSDRIVAVGLEDAAFLELDYPGLKYVRADGLTLPFPDQSFDLVVSFAVVEHVGSRQRQAEFVRELCRVGRAVAIATPNRWYPIEFHTVLPVLHWLPPAWFRQILRWLGKGFWAEEANLNLLDNRALKAMFPVDWQLQALHHRLLGMVSNLFFYATPSAARLK
jgi:SAM-dependent methyltransferase